ncbi:endolytic transglycosylase MltG [Parvibaculum sp. MBR-TMA-1.3b-4.2]
MSEPTDKPEVNETKEAAQTSSRGFFMKLVLWHLIGLPLFVALLAGGFFLYGKWKYEAPGPAEKPVVVMLPKGIGVRDIAGRLEGAGAISDEMIFRLGVRLEGADAALKAGEYEIPAQASMASIVGILRAGKSIQHRITLPEGLTSEQIMAIVAKDPVLKGKLPETPPEGSLLPETYSFTRGTTRAEIVARMREAHDKLIDKLWAGRAKDLPVKTKEEAVILASIVEKETGLPEERPLVASVFTNRLKMPMRLQSDPTIIYGLVGGKGPLGRPLRRSEIAKATPYNTYVIDGLPPTPICNPGEASLRAVLDPPETRHLYFVADGTGGHVFSDTLAQHRRNVAKWRKVERERRRKQGN